MPPLSRRPSLVLLLAAALGLPWAMATLLPASVAPGKVALSRSGSGHQGKPTDEGGTPDNPLLMSLDELDDSDGLDAPPFERWFPTPLDGLLRPDAASISGTPPRSPSEIGYRPPRRRASAAEPRPPVLPDRIRNSGPARTVVRRRSPSSWFNPS